MRAATAADAERIAQLHIASWQATYTNELPSDFLAAQDAAVRAQAWRNQIEHGVEVQIAEEHGSLVGFVACGPARHGEASRSEEWEIYNLHVAPSRHGEGIGCALFDAAVRLGRGRGAEDLMLWVVRTNTAARRFYERRGMRHDGGQQDRSIAPGHALHEVRYRMKSPGSPA